MRDAVADVIEERQALSRREWSGYPASIVLHALIVLALVGVARVPDVPQQPVLTVRLAAAQPAAQAAKASVTSSAPPAAKIEPPPPPKEEPKKAPPALKNQETLFGEAAKPKAPKNASPAETSPPREAPVTAGATFAEPTRGIGLPGVGSAGVTGLEGGDFPYTFYLERMVGLVGDNWLRPQTGADITAEIYFRIDRNGAIHDARVSKSSGSSVFDRAALRAVLESSPLPGLPGGYRDRYLGVHLTFH